MEQKNNNWYINKNMKYKNIIIYKYNHEDKK